MQRVNYPTVITDQPVPDEVYAHNGGATFILGLVELISAVLLAIFLIVGASLSNKPGVTAVAFPLALIGIICFVIPAILCGAFAIAAGRSKSTCSILTTMVFAILNALLVSPYIIFIGGALIKAGEDIETLENQLGVYGSAVKEDVNGNAMVGIGVMLLLIGLAQFVAAIMMSAFACHGTCCCRPYPGQINNPAPINMGNVAVGMAIDNGGGPQLPTYGYDQPKI